MPGGGEEKGSGRCWGRRLPPTGPGGPRVLVPWAGQPRAAAYPGRAPGSLLPLLCLTQPRRFPRPTHLSSISGLAVPRGQGRCVDPTPGAAGGRGGSKEPPVDGGVHMRIQRLESQSGHGSLPSSLGEVVHSLPPHLPSLSSRVKPLLRAEERKMLPVSPGFG